MEYERPKFMDLGLYNVIPMFREALLLVVSFYELIL